MMYRVFASFLALFMGVSAVGAEPWPLFDGCRWRMPPLKRCRCMCADDYQPKSLPCVCRAAQGCCDDYCPKPLPCVPRNARGCTDDYCPKNCPIWLRDAEPWFRCPTTPEPCDCPRPSKRDQPCGRCESRPSIR